MKVDDLTILREKILIRLFGVLKMSQVNGRIEDMSAKNESQEKEIETLKNTSTNSLKQLEKDSKQLKQENESLKLLKQQNESLQEENIQLKRQIESLKLLQVENESLKLEISELKKGQEIIDVSSDSKYEVNEQSNLRKRRRRIGNGESDLDGTPMGQSGQTETLLGQNNPLMMEDLVRIFMEFVNPRDLGSCRVVSKMWNIDATKQMKTKCTFRLDFFYPEKVERFLQIAPIKFSGFRRLILDTSVLRSPEKNLNKLFIDHGKSLHRVRVQFGSGSSKGFGMNEFRDSFLPSLEEIKCLSLQGFPCFLLHEPKIFYHGIQVLSTLTEIYIGFESTCSQRIHEGTQVFSDILRIAPNLESFHWKEKQGHNRVDGSKIMIKSLIQINPPKLEHLYLYSEIPTAVVTLLANSQLELKRLYFSDLNGFKVDLATPGTGWVIELTPLRLQYYRILGQELKQYLENELAEFEEALCIELLKTFLSTLEAKLTGSGG